MHFTSHYSTPHHIKRFNITHHSITSHQKILHHTIFHVTPFHTIPHHTTIAQHSTSHYYIPHVPHHISQTFDVATRLTSDHHILHLASHYTAVCLPPPVHTTTSPSTTYFTPRRHSPHLAPFHTHNYSTPHPHSASQHISHHILFHITLHHHILILYHTTTSDIATRCIIFHI